MRHVLWVAVLVVFGGLPLAAEGQDSDTRKVQHEVEQAMLYLKMGIPQRAVESLRKLVAEPPGKRDPVAWLALGRAFYTIKNVDEAGLAVLESEKLGIQDRLEKLKPWAQKFHQDFRKTVGQIGLRAACDTVEFPIRLAAPMVDKTKRALLESIPGWREERLVRSALNPFFLPIGKYKLGDLTVEVQEDVPASVAMPEISGKCSDLPVVVMGPAGPEVIDTRVNQTSFVEKNWIWLALGGAAVVAGSVAAAVVATQSDDVTLIFD